MGKGFRHHAPLRLLLQTIVADRGRGIERFGDVARVQLLHVAGMVAPHARVAIGLQCWLANRLHERHLFSLRCRSPTKER